MADWFLDESLWEGLYPAMFGEPRLEVAEREIDQLIELLGVEPGRARRSVLDLCCGPGRHAIALARRGWAVTAVDGSAFLLGKARARAQGVPGIEWVREDMRRFRREGAFDLAINLFTSFGYFEEPGEDLQVLRHLHASLQPGGTLVMDLMGKEILARIRQETLSRELPDGALLVQRNQVLDDWTRVRNTWTILRDGKATDHVFTHRIYSAAELKSLCAEAGFRDLRCHGDLLGSPYGADSNRLVLVATRP